MHQFTTKRFYKYINIHQYHLGLFSHVGRCNSIIADILFCTLRVYSYVHQQGVTSPRYRELGYYFQRAIHKVVFTIAHSHQRAIYSCITYSIIS